MFYKILLDEFINASWRICMCVKTRFLTYYTLLLIASWLVQ